MATDSWIVDADGNCSDAADWSTGIPQSGDNVVIATADRHTITFNSGSASGNSLTLGDDVFVIATGTITVGSGTSLGTYSTVSLTGGNFVSTGSATLSGGSVNGSKQFETLGATSVSGFTIGGTVDWVNTGTVTQSGGTVTVGDSLGNIAEVDNQSGATWDIADASGIGRGSAAGSYILNAGTFAKTSTTGVSVITVDFRDTGTVSCAGGNLRFDGPQNSLAGTYIGPGMIDYGPDGVSTLGNLAFTQGACGTNFGVVNVAGVVTIADGSTLKNLAQATWNFAGDVGLALAAGSSNPLFTNMGSMAKTAGTGTSAIGIDVTDEGTVKVAVGTLAFDGASNSVSGAINGQGAIVFGGDTAIDSGAILNVAHWSITGAATSVTLNESLTYVGTFSEGANDTLVLSGGSLALQGASTLSGALSGSDWLHINNAAATISTMTIGGTAGLTNVKTLTQSGGTVTVGDSLGNIAEIDNQAGATWDIADASGIGRGSAAGSYILNAGTFAKTSTTGVSVITVDFRDTGTVSCAGGNLRFDGPQNSLAGTYIGPGMIDYGPDGVSTLGNLTITEGACGTNFGVVNVAGVVTIADGSTLKNLAQATWNFAGDVGLALAAGSSNPLFTNMGSMAKTAGTGTSAIGIDVTDEGTVKVAVGTLAFDGASNSVSGTINGQGAIVFGGDTAIDSGAILNVAHWSITGAATTVTLNESLTYVGTFSEGANDTLVLSGGLLALQGASTLSGALGGSYWLHTNNAAATISTMTIGGTAGLTNVKTLSQSGGTVTVGDNLGDTSMLFNQWGATYDITDDSGIARGSSVASSVNNGGLFEKTGGTAVSKIAPAVANLGTIEVTAATLDLQRGVSGTGADTISGASILEFDSTVAAGQTVSFAGVGGELVLDDPQAFAAKISGFDTIGAGSNDTIALAGPFVYSGFTENAGNTQGTLNLVDGSVHASVTLLGNYVPANFVASHGLITYT